MALFSCEPSLYFLLEGTVNHVALGTMSLLARSLYKSISFNIRLYLSGLKVNYDITLCYLLFCLFI